MNVKIRKGDTVEVISGSLEDKGKRGEVIIVHIEDRRVVVQGVNIRTKHQPRTHHQTRPHQDRRSPGHFERHAGLPEMQRSYPCQRYA
jgi:ribosomal protein L24